MIGNIAAVLTTVSFLPQVIQVIRTKNTEGISLRMYTMFVLGVFFWAIYGYTNKDIQVLVANTITFVLASIVLSYKIKYSIKKANT
jgi:MtN3 and saliva related transmembrane protein